MLKINIVCVGDLKEKFFVDAQSEYLKRLQKYCQINIKEVKECNKYSMVDQIVLAESELIQNQLCGHVVLMDVKSEQMTSEAFAEYIKKISQITSEITFVVGGSYGVSDKLKSLANKKMSFSLMTFPHRLFRIMLLEQIYRAFCINNNTPYHK